MPLAKIDLTVPDDVWIGVISSAHPDVVFRVVSTQYDGEIATALVEIEGEEIVQILSQATGDADIVELDLYGKTRRRRPYRSKRQIRSYSCPCRASASRLKHRS